MASAQSRADDAVLNPVHHVFEPHRVGLPKLAPYFRELWRRREFAAELSRANMRAANSNTAFGQAWLILNPLLLAGVYYILVNVLGSSSKRAGMDYFSHLCGGLFAFYYVSGCISTGATSVVSGGSLLMNTAFPRLLMPLGAVRTAFYRFLPTMPVYFLFHLLARNPITWRTVFAILFLLMLTAFGAGLAAVFATLQVYFRDTASFLPYFVRLWLYVSPVLWFIDDVKPGSKLHLFAHINPLWTLLGGYMDLLQRSEMPPLSIWLQALAWTVGTCLVGFGYFMSREREFTVRV